MSQDGIYEGRTKHRKSPSSLEEEVSWEWEREKTDRRDKKRISDYTVDEYDIDYTKRRKSKQNGEPNSSSMKDALEKEHKVKASHSSRKDQFIDGDISAKLKTKEKREKSSSKKQKK